MIMRCGWIGTVMHGGDEHAARDSAAASMASAVATAVPTAVPNAGAVRFRAEGGSLYVVATPLGNLRDVTLRALDILGSSDIVAAEDTRVSGTLLRHYGIATRMISLHAHNEARRAESLIEHLREGRSVALVTDAGTPGISDPGARLVAAVRDANLPVVPIPGPSAAIAAISAAGLVAEHFFFVGFLPSQPKARRALLAAVGPLPCALVLYEAPHRIGATLAELVGTLEADRSITIARELSKRFETIAVMPLRDAPEWVGADANRERGEFVLIVDVAAKPVAPAALDATGERWLRALLEQLPPAQAARIAATATGVARDAIYAQAIAMKPDSKDT